MAEAPAAPPGAHLGGCDADLKQMHLDLLCQASMPARRELCAMCCADILLHMLVALLVDNMGPAARARLDDVHDVLVELVAARLEQTGRTKVQ